MQNKFQEVIPHLRAIDFDLKKEFPLTKFMKLNKIKSVLVIAGDPPQDQGNKTYRNTSCELIRVLKKELPELKIYAGVDQYRSSIRKELDYIHDKLDAGADGFFTQPFFDLKFLDIYMDIMRGIEVFWGISPIHSEESQSYWENRNDAIFPSNFEPNKKWNVEYGRKMIEKIKTVDGNIYFMPIRAKATEYLHSVLTNI